MTNTENRHTQYKKPLPLGKGPPAGRGIGGQMKKQPVSTYETDFKMRQTKSICTVFHYLNKHS